MQGPALLFGIAQRPILAGYPVAQELFNLFDQPVDIDNGMAGEDLGQTLGEIAGQTAARTFVQEQLHDKLISLGPPVTELDIVGSLGGIAEEGVEKNI